MYRLLIVDDEEIITDSLYEVFRHIMPDELDVCRAYSAKEALSWLARTRIDLVLTDIAMPGMTGLELTEEIRKHWPRCKVIFLTGYSKFEYAYQAIQIPHVRYLLKTEGYDKVTQTVMEVIKEIQQSNQLNQIAEYSLEQTIALEVVEQENYFRHLLKEYGTIGLREEEISESFNKFGIGLNPSAPVMLVLGHLKDPHDTTYLKKCEIRNSAKIIISSYLMEQTCCIVIKDNYGDLLCLLQPLGNMEPQLDHSLVRFLEGTLELVQEACWSTLGLKIGFIISGGPCEWKALTYQYDRLRQIQQFIYDDGVPSIRIDRENPIETSSNKEGLVAVNHKTEMMLSHLEAGRALEFYEILDELLEASKLNGNIQNMIESYYSVALLLYSQLNRLGLWSQTKSHNKLLRLDEHSSIKEGFLYLRQNAEMVFSYKRMDEKDRASLIINRICKYIEEHLSDDLSLVRLAEIHYFNPSYLSRFFKQEHGMNLSEYIEKCRIRKAKELLRGGDIKIREVAVKVGYDAAHSFTRFFKKTTGMTPQEYRDNLLMNNELL